MRQKLRPRRPSHSVVVAYLALFVALGGSSYAALTVTGKNVKDSSLTGKDVKNESLSGADVKNGSLLSGDFRAGQLPAGAQGPAGDPGSKGDKGDKGDTGTVDTSNFYDKAASDGRFLGTAAKAADSELLDGIDSGGFVKNDASSLGMAQGNPAFAFLTVPGHGELRGACANPAQPTVSWKNTSGADQRLFVDDGTAAATYISPVSNDTAAGDVTGSTTVADHVTYMVREPGMVWIDVFDTPNGSGGCFFYARVYGG